MYVPRFYALFRKNTAANNHKFLMITTQVFIFRNIKMWKVVCLRMSAMLYDYHRFTHEEAKSCVS